MILFYMIDVNVEDIWIELTLSIAEKLARGIFYKNLEGFVFVLFQIYLVDVQLSIVSTYYQVVIVIEFELLKYKCISSYISHLERSIIDVKAESGSLREITIHIEV